VYGKQIQRSLEKKTIRIRVSIKHHFLIYFKSRFLKNAKITRSKPTTAGPNNSTKQSSHRRFSGNRALLTHQKRDHQLKPSKTDYVQVRVYKAKQQADGSHTAKLEPTELNVVMEEAVWDTGGSD
jgi:hypothetical protein